MLKRIALWLCALALAVSCAACSDDMTDDRGQTVEESAWKCLEAMYSHDAQTYVEYFPPFTYDMLLDTVGVKPKEGETEAKAVFNYFKEDFEKAATAKHIMVDTKLAESQDEDAYLKATRDFYVKNNYATEAQLDKIQTVVFVAYNADVTYTNGVEYALDGYEKTVPCVKIDGNWYVDCFYHTMVATK